MIGWAFRTAFICSLAVGVAYYAYEHRETLLASAQDSSTHEGQQKKPSQRSDAANRTVIIRADHHGQFWIEGRVNHADVHFMIDTGASGIALNREDAEAAGIHLDARDFTLQSRTANGIARAAPIQIRTLEVGPIEMRKLPGHVMQGSMRGMGLLGMTFLRRLQGFEVRDDKLFLYW
jgi:aspartyl protease family protein